VQSLGEDINVLLESLCLGDVREKMGSRLMQETRTKSYSETRLASVYESRRREGLSLREKELPYEGDSERNMSKQTV